jgi:hypothetical protein
MELWLYRYHIHPSSRGPVLESTAAVEKKKKKEKKTSASICGSRSLARQPTVLFDSWGWKQEQPRWTEVLIFGFLL